MNYQDKTKEELIKELEELQHENNSLKASHLKDIARYKQNEIQLQISEAQKNAILNGISSNIAFVDKELKIIWANKTAADSVNKTPEEMIGQTCHHFWGDPSKPCENCPSIKSFSTKKSESTIQYTPDGRIWDERGEPIFDIDGNVIGVVEIATEITEYKKIENELIFANEFLQERENEAKNNFALLNSIFESPQSIIIFSLDTGYCYTAFSDFHRQTMKNIWGVDIEKGMNMLDVILDPADREKAKNNFDRTLKGEFLRFEEEYGDPKLYRTHYENFYNPIIAANGDVFGIAVFVIDITERKHAEREVHKIKANYDEVVRRIPVGIYKLRTHADGRLNFEYASEKFCKMLGLEEMDVLNNSSSVLRVVHPDDLPSIIESQMVATKTLEPFRWEGRCRIWGKMGWIRIDAEAIRLSDGSCLWNGVIFDITAQKQAEESLRQREARLLSYFELPIIGIAITSPEKGWIEANEGLKAILGYSMEELANLTWAELTHPDDLVADLEQFNKVMSDEQDTYFLEKRFIRKNGDCIWTNMSAGCVRKPDRSVDYLVALLQDISERKQAENELRISEERYRLLAENTRDVIWTMKPDGTITYISPSVELMRGLTVEEAMNQPLEQILTPDSQAKVVGYIQKLNSAVEADLPLPTFREELEYYCKDGSIVWTECFTYPVPGIDSSSLTMLGVTRDISERKRAEQLLLESEQRFRNNIEHVNLISAMLDTKGNITFANNYFLKHTGWQLEDVLGRNWFELFIPPEIELREILFQEFDKGSVPTYHQNEIITRTGERRLIEWSNTLLRDAQGNSAGIAGIGIDITDRKQAEEALKLSAAELRELNPT